MLSGESYIIIQVTVTKRRERGRVSLKNGEKSVMQS